MACIKSCAGYIPFLRVKGEELKNQMKVSAPFQKAVASYDEDPVTLAYECVRSFVDIIEGKEPVAVFFVSSSFRNSEKNPAVLLAETLDLPENTLTFNLTGGNSSFLDAMYLASFLVDSGKVKYSIVVGGEKRRSDDWTLDLCFSDAGGGVLISPDDEKEYIFKIDDFFSLSVHTFDAYKSDSGVQVSDERFIAREEYIPILKKVQNIQGKKFFVSAPTYGISSAILRALKIKDDVFQTFGNIGSAWVPVMLSYLTGSLQPGENFFMLSFGTGLKGVKLSFSGEKSPYEKIIENFERKRFIGFGDYIRIRDVEGFPEDESSVYILWRERKQNLRFYGQRCKDCGSVIFPIQNYCIVCGGKNLIEEKLPKKGKIFTFTEDYLTVYSEIFPPIPMLVVQLENGARIYLQGTDFDPKDSFKIGDDVELTLRILNSWKGEMNYFYKARKVHS